MWPSLAILSVPLALAAGPYAVPIQGTLTDAAGLPLNGTHAVVLALRGGPSGNDLCHSASEDVLFVNGAFAIAPAFSRTQVCDFEGLSLVVSVDGGPATEPVPVGWALRAAWADEAGEAAHAAEADHATEADHADSADRLGAWLPDAFLRWASGVSQGAGVANRVVVTNASGDLTTAATLPVANGGTGATSASGARTALGAAAAGANSDITALTGLTTAIPVASGGTGATSASGARTALGAAASGANSDITSLTGLTSAIPVTAGGTGATSAAAAFAALSPMASKGDLPSHTGAAPTRLTVGANGQLLSADATTATGLRWIDAPATNNGSAGQLVQAAAPPVTCATGTGGAMYFDTALLQVRVCNGAAWVNLGTSGAVAGQAPETARPSCEAILAAAPTSTSGLYWIDPNGAPTSDAYQVYCRMDIANGGWTLAFNLDTSDGTARHWNDTGFWQGAAAVGTAANALTADYKSAPVWATDAAELLVLVHREGSEIVGWKSYGLAATASLSRFMQHDISKQPAPLTASTTASNVTNLDARENVIRASGNLRVNVRWGAIGSMDYSRVRNETVPDTDDAQYALGSLMNVNDHPRYPACEAGASPPWTGYYCIGADRVCNECGSTSGGTRDLEYDYAFFVRGVASGVAPDPALVGNSAATAATSCNALKTARPTAASALYWVDVDGASGNAASQTWCEMTLASGGWTLAFNLDSSDGNVRNWRDTGFWTGTGGFGVAASALSNDFKNGAVFSQSGYTQLMLVVHREGLQTIGWRAWSLANTNALQNSFANTPLAGPGLSTTATALTGASFASDVAALSGSETVVRPADILRLNMAWGAGGSQDWSRIRSNATPNTDDGQFGLGAQMNHNDPTRYPACEVGSSGSWSSYYCIGRDRACTECGSTDWDNRDLEYDYAVYVR